MVRQTTVLIARFCLVGLFTLQLGAAEPKSLVIGVDGLGYGLRGLDATNTPNIDSLRDGSWAEGYRGAYSDNAFAGGVAGTATQQTTVSGPGWSSMLSGVWIDQHKVSGNSFRNPNFTDNEIYLETLEQNVPDLYSASVVNWDPIDTHIIATADDSNSQIDFRQTTSDDFGVMEAVANQLERLDADRPAAIFLGFDEVDGAGHSCGSSGQCYTNEIREVDLLIGRLLTTIERRPSFAEEAWQIVLTADHGHRANGGHGGQSELERRIPFIVSSSSLEPGAFPAPLSAAISQADVAPTVLSHFNFGAPSRYAGASRAAGATDAIIDPPPPPIDPPPIDPPPVQGPPPIFSEDFEGIALGPNIDEDSGNRMPAVWSKSPPANWTISDNVPGQDEANNNNGVTEWIGWSFTDRSWWANVAGDQNRTQFTNGQGTIAVADPDEWDDASHPDSAASGWYNTVLQTPNIALDGLLPGTVELEFDSSWRPEATNDQQQTAIAEVSFDGGEPVEILRWESRSNSDNFKRDATNETVRLDIDTPEGAQSMSVAFSLVNAGNNWWWALDNINLYATVEGDFNEDNQVSASDIDLMSAAIIDGDVTYDLTQDAIVDQADRSALVIQILGTWFGDANLDGEFNSGDLVQVMGLGEYEDPLVGNSTWASGDWDGDLEFTTSDLTRAFADGGYEQGLRAAAVPEPTINARWLLALVSIRVRQSRRRSNATLQA